MFGVVLAFVLGMHFDRFVSEPREMSPKAETTLQIFHCVVYVVILETYGYLLGTVLEEKVLV